MSDLVKDIKYLRFYHQPNDALKDKDILKNQSFRKYAHNVQTLFLIPLGLQFWQLLLVNNVEKASIYRRVRIMKCLTFVAAVGLSTNEKLKLEKQWDFYNRFYAEPTELQKQLFREAMLFKEGVYQQKSDEERTKLDADTAKVYEQLYRLPAQRYPDADDNPNPPSIQTHY